MKRRALRNTVMALGAWQLGAGAWHGMTPARAEDVVAAVVAPLSGPHATAGRSVVVAAQFTADVINAAGGVGGRKLKLAVVDDPCLSGSPVEAFETVALSPAAVVVGHLCAPTAIAAGPIYQRTGKLVIGVDERPRAGPRAGPLAFRMAGTSKSQGAFIGQRLVADLRGATSGRIALLSDRTAFAVTLVRDAAAALAEGGVTPALVETFAAGTLDFGSLATRVAGAGVTHVVIAGFPAEAAPLMHELLAARPELSVVGSDSIATPEFVELAGEAAGRVRIALVPSLATLRERTTTAERFGGALEAAGVVASVAAMHTAAALEVWAAAASADGKTVLAPTAVAERLVRDKGMTLLGALQFDGAGTALWTARLWYRWGGNGWKAEPLK